MPIGKTFVDSAAGTGCDMSERCGPQEVADRADAHRGVGDARAALLSAEIAILKALGWSAERV
jgi:hypothetical protein